MSHAKRALIAIGVLGVAGGDASSRHGHERTGLASKPINLVALRALLLQPKANRPWQHRRRRSPAE
jgi:hypothetical protein